MMERSVDSSPQSLTTTHEQLTTLRALPSRSKTPNERSCISIHPGGTGEGARGGRGGRSQGGFPGKEGGLTETGPLAKLLAVLDLDEGDLVLGAEGDDELLVGLLLAVLVQDAHVSLTSVEGLGGLAEAAG